MRRLIAAGVLLSACGCSLQTLGAPKGDLTLYAVFDDVQNLVPGHSVQMADVPIGSVTAVELEGYKVKVTLSIVDGTRIPAGTTATLAKMSLLGENFVRLRPPPSGVAGPEIPDRTVITETAVQPGLEQVGERVAPVLAALGGEDLNAAVEALSGGLTGQGAKLHQIIERSTSIADDYAAAGRDLAAVLDGLGRLGDRLADSGGALDALPGALVTATERIQKDRRQLKAALTELTGMAEAVNDTIGVRHGERLRRLLVRLDDILTAMIRGKDELKAFTEGTLNGFAKAPSMSYEGQGLINVWLNGFLPSGTRTRPAPDFGTTLQQLLGPE